LAAARLAAGSPGGRRPPYCGGGRRFGRRNARHGRAGARFPGVKKGLADGVCRSAGAGTKRTAFLFLDHLANLFFHTRTSRSLIGAVEKASHGHYRGGAVRTAEAAGILVFCLGVKKTPRTTERNRPAGRRRLAPLPPLLIFLRAGTLVSQVCSGKWAVATPGQKNKKKQRFGGRRH